MKEETEQVILLPVKSVVISQGLEVTNFLSYAVSI